MRELPNLYMIVAVPAKRDFLFQFLMEEQQSGAVHQHRARLDDHLSTTTSIDGYTRLVVMEIINGYMSPLTFQVMQRLRSVKVLFYGVATCDTALVAFVHDLIKNK